MLKRLIGAWRLPITGRIGADQLSAVISAAPAALLCGIVNAVIVMLDLYAVVPGPELLAWSLLFLAVTATLFARVGNRAARETSSLSTRALRRTVLLTLLSASPWALLGTLYLGHLPHTNELILIAICAGMSASGSILLAPVYPAALAYMSAILLPFAVKCFASAGYELLGLLTASYGAFLAAVIATTARLSVERTQALRALRERDGIISTQNLRFETALNNMTQGLCFFDKDEKLIVCNRRYIDMYGLDPDRVRPGVPLREIVGMRYAAGSCPQ